VSAAWLALFATCVPAVTAQEAAWVVERASISFETRNAGLPVRGSFEEIEAAIAFDPRHPGSGHLTASVDPTTIRTGIAMRDRHLTRRGWFDVERFGPIRMRSLELRRTEDAFLGTFLLTIRDVEREVAVPFTFEKSGRGARIAGSLTIDRLDFGIGRRSPILADEVEIRVELDLVQPSGRRAGPLGAIS
jgi:polyisoprenoid-binding protein YceI